ncbi:MAG: hypothetical protein HY301_09130 [Verrucomicrobia bacterium]|nr:hypothetical protein [Verrucomicrobiota bacterium]
MTKRRLILLVLALVAGLSLVGFLSTRPAPTVVWLRNYDEVFASRAGWMSTKADELTAIVKGWLGLGNNNRIMVGYGPAILSGRRQSLDALTPVTPAFTNADGTRVWVLNRQAQEDFATRRKAQPPDVRPTRTDSAQMQTSLGMQAEMFMGEYLSGARIGLTTNAPRIHDGLQVRLHSEPHGQLVTYTVAGLHIAAVPLPGPVATMTERTNFDFALRAALPRGSGLLIRPAATNASNGDEFMLLLVPVLLDAKGQPLWQ